METVQRASDANVVEDKWLKVGEVLILPKRNDLNKPTDEAGAIALNDSNQIIYKDNDGRLRELQSTYSVSLSKEAMTLAADSNGNVSLSQLARTNSTITALVGEKPLIPVAPNDTPGAGQFSYKIKDVLGGTASRVNNESFKLSTMSGDVAQITLDIALENKASLTKVMSISRASSGLPGLPGKDGEQGPQGPPGDGSELDLDLVNEIIDKQLEIINQVIADIAADDKVTSSEKTILRLEIAKIQNEYQALIDQATLYQLTSLRVEYQTAYLSLMTYMEPILVNDDTYVINAAQFQSKFATYYAKKANLQKAITAVMKDNIDQVKATAEGVEKITDFWHITLDDQSGLIAAGTMLVGTSTYNNAGMTGVTDKGAQSVRFFAGAPYANRNVAPFRVLDNGNIWLGSNANGMDWGITRANTLTIRGALIQDAGGNIGDVQVFRGAWNATTTYYKGNIVTYLGSTWYYKADVASNSTPVEGAMWTIYAQKGASGESSYVEIQYSVDGQNNWHSTFTNGDIFMRQRTGQTSWSNPIRVVGEAGAVGADGKYTSYEFSKNTSLTTPPTTGFTDAPPSLSANEYLWTRIGKFGPSGQIGPWSTPVRITGPQGEPGVPGEPGSSLYTWVKYGDNASGAGMSDFPNGKMYIGLAYNKPIPSESQNPADYTWALIVGQGVPGEKGADGKQQWTWIKYADTPTTGMSDDPTGKKYLGMAYNKSTAEESTNYSDYNWSLIRGADGAQGVPGADGKSTEFRFAKNGSTTTPPTLATTTANPSGWTIAQPTLGALEYMWMTSAVKNGDGTLSTNWSTPVRTSGKDGNNGGQGAPGAVGPYVMGRGEYNASKTYYGGADRVEVVKYGGVWYVTRTDAGNIAAGTLPTTTSKWNNFGGQFESVATDLLFANMAYIDNLGVRNLRTSDAGKRVAIDGAENNFKLYNASNQVLIEIDDDVFTGYSPSPDPPYVKPRYSAGITVGVVANGKYSSLTDELIHTTGSLTVEGSSSLGEKARAGSFVSNVEQTSGLLPNAGMILATGNCNLYQYPDDGQMQIVKNISGGQITISAERVQDGRTITTMDNTSSTTFNILLIRGGVMQFVYSSLRNSWIMISNSTS